MLGGRVDWSALPIVAARLGVDDIEWLSTLLLTIRDFNVEREQ